MPTLQAMNISHQFDNGDTLFSQISCSMTKSRVGLVGRNGVGKSLFSSILLGELMPSSGVVKAPSSFAIYRQQASHLLQSKLSIAEYLGKDAILNAIHQVESGDCNEHWFDLIGNEWDLGSRLKKQLVDMKLPSDPHFPCAQLSGGQLARLQLWQLFEQHVDLLVLDEPSNHLDRESKQWLSEQIHQFDGAVLLISHDRQLLREMDEIWELSGLGLRVFGGNYDDYAKQKNIELQAVERQLATIAKDKKQLAEQAQRNHEKAQQRAAQGNKARKDGSQPKILLDAKKDKATAGVSNRLKNEQLRHAHLQQKEQSLIVRKEQLKTQKIYLTTGESSSKQVISLLEAQLAYGRTSPISLQISANEKIHLTGENGCGKSTLLKTLLGDVSLCNGELKVNTPLYYLDQHFAVVSPRLSLLENLLHHCQGIIESEARTLLAGIGFRRDNVFRLGEQLSGGEKMKLAMLIVSHQPSKPLLLLDEPDNHLDIDGKTILARALKEYCGGFILISHDQDFAEESGITKVVQL